MTYKLFRKVYDEFVYAAQNLTWQFSDKAPNLDQLADNLRRIGLKPSYINRYLNSKEINITFQDAVLTDDLLVGRVVSDAISLSYSPSRRISHNRRKKLITKRFADYLREKNSVATSQ